jgi:hypothetical protein
MRNPGMLLVKVLYWLVMSKEPSELLNLGEATEQYSYRRR